MKLRKALDKAKILKAAEVKILSFKNVKQTGISTITFVPIAEFSSSVLQDKPLLSPGDILWAAGWVIKARNPDFQHSNWNGWMKSIHAEDAKQNTQVDFLPVIDPPPLVAVVLEGACRDEMTERIGGLSASRYVDEVEDDILAVGDELPQHIRCEALVILELTVFYLPAL